MSDHRESEADSWVILAVVLLAVGLILYFFWPSPPKLVVQAPTPPTPTAVAVDKEVTWAVTTRALTTQEICQWGIRTADKYSREAFGDLWQDEDRDGQDAREEVLLSEMTATWTFDNRTGENSSSSYLTCPYTGQRVDDRRKIDIDHVVALKEAWDWGAALWTPEKRADFANYLGDSDHLMAVLGTENRRKGSKGIADGYLPPKHKCEYILARIRIWENPRWGFCNVPLSEKEASLKAIAEYCPPIMRRVEITK